MIKAELVHEIQRLLATGKLTRRNIAQRLGVARGTVSAVAEGKFHARSPVAEPPQPEPPSDLAARERRRCPTCRAMVHMPCKLCRIRRRTGGQRIPPLDPPPEGPIGLELLPIHQARYAQIRRWRRRGIWLGITHGRAAPVLNSGSPCTESSTERVFVRLEGAATYEPSATPCLDRVCEAPSPPDVQARSSSRSMSEDQPLSTSTSASLTITISPSTSRPMNRKHRPRPETKASPPEPRIPQLYQVVVQCTDEADQRHVYQRLTAENRTCRLILL